MLFLFLSSCFGLGFFGNACAIHSSLRATDTLSGAIGAATQKPEDHAQDTQPAPDPEPRDRIHMTLTKNGAGIEICVHPDLTKDFRDWRVHILHLDMAPDSPEPQDGPRTDSFANPDPTPIEL